MKQDKALIFPRTLLFFALTGVVALSTFLLFHSFPSSRFILLSFLLWLFLSLFLPFFSFSPSPFIWELTFLTAAGITCFRYYQIGHLLFRLGEFLYLIQILRLLQAEIQFLKNKPISPRNSIQIFVICLVHLAIFSIAQISFTFLFYLLALLVLFPFIFLPLYLQKDFSSPIPLRSLLSFCLTVALFKFFLLIFFFFLLPRPKKEQWRQLPQARMHLSGFSPSVDLDDISYILPSPQVVMRVFIRRPLPPEVPRLLRGMTYDTYHNRQWKRTQKETPLHLPQGEIYFRKPEETLGEIEIQQLPLTSHSLFTMAGLIHFKMVSPKLRNLLFCTDNTLSLPQPISRILQYRLSVSAPKESFELTNMETFLSFPENLPKEKFFRLAKKIAGHQQQPAKICERIVRYLHTYQYTLDLSDYRGKSKDPIEVFLFEKKRGHCELFASSMVFLLRALGIPSRLVNGFRLEEYNPVGKYYIVRQKHAHAWVEAWIDNQWRTYDPTPPRRFPSHTPWWQENSWIDYLNMQWNQWVILYSWQDQQKLYQSLWKGGFEILSLLGEWRKVSLPFSPGTSLSLPLFLLFLLPLLLFLLFLCRRRAFQKEFYPLPFWLQRLIHFLNKRGIPTPSSKSLGETFAEAGEKWPSCKEEFQELLKFYYLERFGKQPNSQAQRLAQELLEKLKKGG